MKALFGTDGIRGEAGQFPLDAATVKHNRFFFSRAPRGDSRRPVIVIGRDTRESGESIELALINGASRAGAKCLSAGVITTPGVAFLTRKLEAAAGRGNQRFAQSLPGQRHQDLAPSGQKMDDSVERMIEADIFEAAGKVRGRIERGAAFATLEEKLGKNISRSWPTKLVTD